ncbi:hypothetical protein TTRE_0000004201 [Trichuris trichiura]|uniref:Uncharacterized protein n=1 Tax=Trichuris trichiura TaxID=36087 RepID=A0A077YWG7_TRITR|nr:hypothetical protein TTRE_0000004201 [Trichuris trichiura]
MQMDQVAFHGYPINASAVVIAELSACMLISPSSYVYPRSYTVGIGNCPGIDSTRETTQNEDKIDLENIAWQQAQSMQNENGLNETNLTSTGDALTGNNGKHAAAQRGSVESLLVQDCLTEIHALHQKLKEYLAIEQELFIVKEKLNVRERQQEQRSWKQYSELLVNMTQKQNEWRQVELTLKMKISSAETRAADMITQMEQYKEERRLLNVEKQKNQDRVLELEAELFRANQKIEVLLQQDEINQLQQRSEVTRLETEVEHLIAEREEVIRRKKTEIEELRQDKIAQERLLQEYETRNRHLEQQLKQGVDDARKSFESDRFEWKAKLDEVERNLQNEAISHERKVNLLLLEVNHLRWERDKALEEVATCRMKCGDS